MKTTNKMSHNVTSNTKIAIMNTSKTNTQKKTLNTTDHHKNDHDIGINDTKDNCGDDKAGINNDDEGE